MKKLDTDFVTLKIEDRVSIMNATGLELIKIINSFLLIFHPNHFKNVLKFRCYF